MHRRSFLKTSAILPIWAAAVARAQEPESEGPPKRSEALRTAWQNARTSGRPLLLLVIPPTERQAEDGAWFPSQPEALQERGLAWGQVLHHGDNEILADLALCVLACATLEEARRTLPKSADVASIEGNPLALLVESDLRGTERIDLELAHIEAPMWWPGGEKTPEEAKAEYERQVKERIAAIGVALRAAVAPNGTALVRRAAQAREALADLPEPVLSAQPDDALRALAARAPAVVREAAEHGPHRAETLAVLASYARENARLNSPAGSLWGESTGCGTRVEGLGDRNLMVMCGMGHVPHLGRRFLFFYTSS